MELANRKEKLALIHLAKKETGLDDTAYRALIAGAAGVDSSRDIATIDQFDAVMLAFKNLGFTRKPGLKRLPVQPLDLGNGLTRATDRQIYYIKGLWELASKNRDERSLKALLLRVGHVSEFRFLDRKGANAMIMALKDICQKAGFDPEGPTK
jgi:hypothetical protein